MSALNKSLVDWETHRKELQNLYLAESRTLKEIATHMEETHHLRATKAQYEIQFKKWDLRKNLTNKEWDYVHSRVEKRKREEKDSDVYFKRTKIPEKKLKKELSRRYTISYKDFTGALSSPSTPEAISISTPNPVSGYTVDMTDLPWFRFQPLMESIVNFNPKQPNSTSEEIGSLILPWQHAFNFASSIEVAFDFRTEFKDDRLSLLFGSLNSTMTVPAQDYISQFRSRMQICSLERYEGELSEKLERFLGRSHEKFLIQSFEFILYLLSNNLLSEARTDRFLESIIKQKRTRLLISCLETQMPTMHAFSTKILESALRIGDATFLQLLIDAGVDTSSFPGIYGGRYLWMAAQNGNTKTAQILLKNGADPNAPMTKRFPTSALQVATSGNFVDLVRVLLSAGAEVDTLSFQGLTALSSAIASRNLVLVRILLEAGANLDRCKIRDWPWNKPGETREPAIEWASRNYQDELFQDLMKVIGKNEFAISIDGIRKASELGASELSIYLAERGENVKGRAKVRLEECLGLRAASGDHGAVLSLLQIGVDPNAGLLGWWGHFGSGISADSKRIILKSLVLAGADMHHSSLLHKVGTWGDPDLLWFLREEGMDFKNYGEQVLQKALNYDPMDHGHDHHEAVHEAVQLLLNFGADVNAPTCDECPYTALQAAARTGDIELAKILIDAGADVNAPAWDDPGCTALEGAIYEDEIELVKILIDAGADVNAPEGDEYEHTALQAAVSCQKIEVVKILIDAGADVNAPAGDENGSTALQAAVSWQKIEVVKILIDAGADVNAPGSMIKGKNALQATMHDHTKVSKPDTEKRIQLMQTLVAAGADLNAIDNAKILISAITHGEVVEVQALLVAGANVDGPPGGMEKSSPIQCAAENGCTSMVNLLLASGASVNAAPWFDGGRTAIQSACSAENANMEVIELLLEASADIHAPAAPFGGLTALQGAAIRGHLAIALRLLELGADVNAPPAEEDGRTALDGAAEHGRLDMVHLLLRSGAQGDPLAKNRFDWAVRLARRYGHFAVARLLETY
ncbi:hypothetical protein MMC22_009558 [Lobaria immixta]|nr:hypothetical protein [Lobaria immixta]